MQTQPLSAIHNLNITGLTTAQPALMGNAAVVTSISRERRKWQRLPMAIPVFVRSLDYEGRPFLEFTTAMNISAGGMLLVLRRNVRPAALVSVQIPAAPTMQTGAATPTLEGRIVRIENGPGWFLYALEFVRPLLEKGETEPKE